MPFMGVGVARKEGPQKPACLVNSSRPPWHREASQGLIQILSSSSIPTMADSPATAEAGVEMDLAAAKVHFIRLIKGLAQADEYLYGSPGKSQRSPE